jgi:hypothetical protein
MQNDLKVFEALKILKRYRVRYDYNFYFTGSYREGDASPYSDVDVILVGESYPSLLMEDIRPKRWLSITFVNKHNVSSTWGDSAGELVLLDGYFKGHVPELFLDPRKILDLHKVSFNSMRNTLKRLKDNNELEFGISIKNDLIYRHFRLFDRYLFNVFSDDPFSIVRKLDRSFTPELKRRNYIIPLTEADNFKDEIIDACLQLDDEFEKASQRLKASSIYNN